MRVGFTTLPVWVLALALNSGMSVFATEYELDGQLSQMIHRLDGDLHTSASFTVFVRDCGWMIKTVETNQFGEVIEQRKGSIDGQEIYECNYPLSHPSLSSNSNAWPANLAVVVSNNIPVGRMDAAVIGHLWLMFASPCYWPKLNSKQLTPVYDWRASAEAGGQSLKVRAEWTLLAGTLLLPREVRYFNRINQPVAIYTTTGIDPQGNPPMPTGFIFEEQAIGAPDPITLENTVIVRKRVEVKVTAVRPVCSLKDLIPTPAHRTWIVDKRVDSGLSNRPASFKNPISGQWPTLEKSKELAAKQRAADLAALNRLKLAPGVSKKTKLIIIGMLLGAPLFCYWVWQLTKKP